MHAKSMRLHGVAPALRIALVLLLASASAHAAAPDDNVEWLGVSHVPWQDRRPLCPVDGETFQVRFQVFRTDITSARVQVDDGTPVWIPASFLEVRGAYDVWAAQVPATAATSLSYFLELTDGTDTDYYSVAGMSDGLPADGGFVLDFVTLEHAPIGATQVTGGAVFKVWSPSTASAHVRGAFNGWGLGNPMSRVGEFWVVRVNGTTDRQPYKYFFDNATWNTDARARDLDPGNNDNALLEDPLRYTWTTSGWQTPPLEEMVIYQLHVGTFSGLNDPFGSAPFPARYVDVENRVAHLVDLGVNAVLLMPVTEFPGDHSAGYNPQTMWAPESRYGNPDALRSLVDALHANGIAVLTDIVWNHFTISGNFMWNYDGTQLYFDTPAVSTPWGDQADFDAQGVRDYFVDSALNWIEEYRIDGFRADGTDFMNMGAHAVSGWTLMQALNDAVDARAIDHVVIAEQLPDDPGVTQPTASGGAGFDAQYFDAFNDNLRQEILDAAFGDPEMWKIRNIINGGGLYLSGRNVVNYLELHDEVWPTSGGQRLVKTIDTTPPHDDVWARGRIKLAQGLVLTSPGVPALFMGSEWLEDTDFGTDAVNRIDWAHKTLYPEIFQYFKDLVALRTGNPALRADAGHVIHHLNETGNVIGFHRFDNAGEDLLVLANFSNTDYAGYRVGAPLGGTWTEIVNSQATTYGGNGLVNPGSIAAEAVGADGFGQSLVLTVPQMGLLVLRHDTTPTDVGGGGDVTDGAGAALRIERVFPMPARGVATVQWSLPASAPVAISVHDARGRRVATLESRTFEAGRHWTRWDGRDRRARPVPAGLYFLRLRTPAGTVSVKIPRVR